MREGSTGEKAREGKKKKNKEKVIGGMGELGAVWPEGGELEAGNARAGKAQKSFAEGSGNRETCRKRGWSTKEKTHKKRIGKKNSYPPKFAKRSLIDMSDEQGGRIVHRSKTNQERKDGQRGARNESSKKNRIDLAGKNRKVNGKAGKTRRGNRNHNEKGRTTKRAQNAYSKLPPAQDTTSRGTPEKKEKGQKKKTDGPGKL